MAGEKKKELTELQQKFLAVLFEPVENGGAGGNVRQAMNIAGYSKSTTQQEVLRSLSDEITNLAVKSLSVNSGKAVFALLDVLNSPNSLGAANKIKAAQAILDRAGVAKRAEDLNLSIPKGGLVILPAKQKRDVNEIDEDKEEET